MKQQLIALMRTAADAMSTLGGLGWGTGFILVCVDTELNVAWGLRAAFCAVVWYLGLRLADAATALENRP